MRIKTFSKILLIGTVTLSISVCINNNADTENFTQHPEAIAIVNGDFNKI